MWPFQSRDVAPAETRDADATDVVVAALQAAAAGGNADPRRTAAVLAGSRFIARCFAACVPTPAHPMITRAYLWKLGQELALHGASYRFPDGEVLRKVQDVEEGSTKSGAKVWKFRPVLIGRDQQAQQTVKDAAFVAIRAPGGVSRQDITTSAYAHIEERIRDDATLPSTSLRTQTGAPGNNIGTQAAIKAAEAATKLFRRMDLSVMPVPAGFELSPTETVSRALPELRLQLESATLASMGVPPELVAPASNGAATRESYRRFIRSSLEPLAAIAAEELSSKLGIPGLALDSRHLHGADASALARAVAALTNSGMSVDEALALVGLD